MATQLGNSRGEYQPRQSGSRVQECNTRCCLPHMLERLLEIKTPQTQHKANTKALLVWGGPKYTHFTAQSPEANLYIEGALGLGSIMSS